MNQRARAKKEKEVFIDREWCKGCGICVAFCPEESLDLDNEGKARWAYPDKCSRCGLCELRCPDLAIEVA
jgi:2-oxoglutarate ferredoxin oxidoreductase subunit delta